MERDKIPLLGVMKKSTKKRRKNTQFNDFTDEFPHVPSPTTQVGADSNFSKDPTEVGTNEYENLVDCEKKVCFHRSEVTAGAMRALEDTSGAIDILEKTLKNFLSTEANQTTNPNSEKSIKNRLIQISQDCIRDSYMGDKICTNTLSFLMKKCKSTSTGEYLVRSLTLLDLYRAKNKKYKIKPEFFEEIGVSFTFEEMQHAGLTEEERDSFMISFEY